ncbi:hypothetical protein AB0H58_32395 [Nocardia neocaledoniensis]|uniref:hypothetical protein n=1 Tax=Nocardia neocaledoniensis TaxID=236511 RepID=UPI0033F885CE
MSEKKGTKEGGGTWSDSAVVFVALPVAAITLLQWPEGLEDRILDAVTTIAIGLAGTLGAVTAIAVAIAISRGRGWRWLLIRRRWQKAVTQAGLTITQGDAVLIPRLGAVIPDRTGEIVQVQMLPTQVPGDWARRCTVLAHVFNAQAASVRLVEHHPTRIDIALVRKAVA